jgi:hypothetical protein
MSALTMRLDPRAESSSIRDDLRAVAMAARQSRVGREKRKVERLRESNVGSVIGGEVLS